MRILVSPEGLLENEIERVINYMQGGVFDIFHLRKPNYTSVEMKKYLEQLPDDVLRKTVIHTNFELTACFQLKGIHLNYHFIDHRVALSQKYHLVSTSCHVFQEIIDNSNVEFEYMFLSPIYASISKEGYAGNFGNEELRDFLQNCKVPIVALGGITEDKVEECHQIGFAGVAMLGSIWQD